MPRRRLTPQERTALRTQRAEKALAMMTLIVPVRSAKEREYVRSHLFYSGASGEYIATYMRMLPLACMAMRKLRGAVVFILEKNSDGQYELRTI